MLRGGNGNRREGGGVYDEEREISMMEGQKKCI
jgi:hypothetical protein